MPAPLKLAENESVVIPLPIETPLRRSVIGYQVIDWKEERKARSNGFFKKFPEAQRKDTILFQSRIDPKKGVELLLDAFGIVRQSQQDVVLVIAGKGSSRM